MPTALCMYMKKRSGCPAAVAPFAPGRRASLGPALKDETMVRRILGIKKHRRC